MAIYGKTRKGNRGLRKVLFGVAHVAAKTHAAYLSAPHRRIAGCGMEQRALVAVAHTVLVIVYHPRCFAASSASATR